MTDSRVTPVFLEGVGEDLWLLTINGEQVPFRTSGGGNMATNMAYEVLASRGLGDLIFQPLASNGRHYAIPQEPL